VPKNTDALHFFAKSAQKTLFGKKRGKKHFLGHIGIVAHHVKTHRYFCHAF